MRFNKSQKRVIEWLSVELDRPAYAEAYQGALLFLKCKPPGYVSFVSHASRDLMNGLAYAKRTRSQVQYPQLVDDFQEDWKDEWTNPGFSMNGNITRHNNDSEDGHLIPSQTCKKIGKLIIKHREGRKRSNESGHLFFTNYLGYDDKETASSRHLMEWEDARQWFQKHDHFSTQPRAKKTEIELKQQFDILHHLLTLAASSEYEQIGDLNEILEKANS